MLNSAVNSDVQLPKDCKITSRFFDSMTTPLATDSSQGLSFTQPEEAAVSPQYIDNRLTACCREQ